MTAKELIASSYHLQAFNSQYNYVQRFQTLSQQVNSVLPNRIHENWYQPLIETIDSLQALCASYENDRKFPMDNNPLVLDLGINSFISVGGLEQLKKFIKSKPSEIAELISGGLAKLQISFETVNALNQQFGRMPLHREAVNFYSIEDNRVLLRLTLPANKSQTLSSEVDESKKLFNNLKPFDMLNKGDTAYTYDVVGISQSSPLEFLLLVSAQCGIALNIVAKAIIKRWNEIEQVRLIRAQIENMNANTELIKAQKDKLLKDLVPLEKAQEGYEEEVANEIFSKFATETSLDGSKAEIHKSLKTSIKYFQDVMENGGSLNVYIAPHIIQESNPENWKIELIEGRKPQSDLESGAKMINQ